MKAAFRVGDRVSFPLGARRAEGIITEYRGPIGIRGRHLYQVEVPRDPFDPAIYELQEDEIEASNGSSRNAPLSPAAVLDYLKNGGLLTILDANAVGGKNQPRVWLCLDTLGNITHTFAEERGRLGGETVPRMAVHERHVFTPKKEEVLKYLRSFSLSKAQAEEVMAEVGTAP